MHTWTLRNLEDGVSTSIRNTDTFDEARSYFGLIGPDWTYVSHPRSLDKWFFSRKSAHPLRDSEDFILIRS